MVPNWGDSVAVTATVTTTGERIHEAAAGRLNVLLSVQSARIAGVLHDDVSQALAAAHMAIEEAASDAPEAARVSLRLVRRQLHEVAEQLRHISHELHPGILDHLGVADAINAVSRAFTRRTGVLLTVSVQLDERCPASVDSVLYRLIEEGLSNIERHARAASASIAVERDGAHLVCTICDDGAGFDAATLARGANHGLGLRLLCGRLEALGGTLDVMSAPHQGTRLHAVIPVGR